MPETLSIAESIAGLHWSINSRIAARRFARSIDCAADVVLLAAIRFKFQSPALPCLKSISSQARP